MSEFADQIADADAADIIERSHFERLAKIRSDLAELMIELGWDPNKALAR